MSYHEGSNWQAKKEDEGKSLYDEDPALAKEMGEAVRGKCGLPEPTIPCTVKQLSDLYDAGLKYYNAYYYDEDTPPPTKAAYFKQHFGIDITTIQ